MEWRSRGFVLLVLSLYLLQCTSACYVRRESETTLLKQATAISRTTQLRQRSSDTGNEENTEPAVSVPVLTEAKEHVQKDVAELLIRGSGFNESDTLTCRLTGFDSTGSVSEGAKKNKVTVTPAKFVSEQLVKCPYDAELREMLEVIVEISNDGQKFSLPLIYHPQRPMTPGKGADTDKDNKKDEDVKSEPQKDPKSADSKEKEDDKGKTSEPKDKEGNKEKEKNPKGKKKAKGNAGEEHEGLGPGESWGFGEIEGAPRGSGWRRKSLDYLHTRPHLGGFLAVLVGMLIIVTFYLFYGRRRSDVAYSRVRNYERAAPNQENGTSANGNAFGLYDEDEENARGWGEWDNEWGKDEESGEPNGTRTKAGPKASD